MLLCLFCDLECSGLLNDCYFDVSLALAYSLGWYLFIGCLSFCGFGNC